MGTFVRYLLVEETPSTVTYDLSGAEEGPPEGRLTVDKESMTITDPEESITHQMLAAGMSIVRLYRQTGTWARGGAAQS